MQKINQQQQHNFQELKSNNLKIIENPNHHIPSEFETPSSSTQFSLGQSSTHKLFRKTKPKEINAHKSSVCFSVIEEQYQLENQPSRGSTTELQVELHAIKEEMNQLKSNMQILTCVLTHIQNNKNNQLSSKSPISSSQMRIPYSSTPSKRINSQNINTEQEDQQQQWKVSKSRTMNPLEKKYILPQPKAELDNSSVKKTKQRIIDNPRSKKLLTISFEDDKDTISTAKRFKTIDNSYETAIENNRSYSSNNYNNNTSKNNKRIILDSSAFHPQKIKESPKKREIPSLLGFTSSKSKQSRGIDQSSSSPKTLGNSAASRFRSISCNSNEGDAQFSSKNRKLNELKQDDLADSIYFGQNSQLHNHRQHSPNSQKSKITLEAVNQSLNSRLKYLEDSSIMKTNMAQNYCKMNPQNFSTILSQQQPPMMILRSPSSQHSSNSHKKPNSSERIIKKADLLAEKIVKNSEYLHSILRNYSKDNDNSMIKQQSSKQGQ